MSSILFLINGLGLGNSTRCDALMTELASRGHDVKLITSGNGAWYFKGRGIFEILDEFVPFQYGKSGDRLSVMKTLGKIPSFFRISQRNEDRLEEALKRFKPHAVVSDSVYNCRAVRKMGIPWIALNNADMVLANFFRQSSSPLSCFAQLAAVESPDYLFHRLMPDLVLSPRLIPTHPTRTGKFQVTGPILRKGYDAAKPKLDRADVKNVLIMVSGSSFGCQINIQDLMENITVDVIGRERSEDWPNHVENVVFHGKILDTRSLIESADMLIVNGGYSAVAESIATGKPTCILPVPNHAEQWVNAKIAEHYGHVIVVEDNDVNAALKALFHNLSNFDKALNHGDDAYPSGCVVAAQAIENLIER